MSGVEKELKLSLLSADDYDRLCARLPGFEGTKEQRNSYWDYPDRRLTAAKVLLRLRVDERDAWITVKREPSVDTDGLFVVPEDEAAIERDQALAVLSGQQKLEELSSEVLARVELEFGAFEGIFRWGSIDNVRRRYRLSSEWLVEVDATTFPGDHIDREIELEGESPREGLELLKPYLTDIETRPQLKSKSQRLHEYLDE